MPVWAEDGVGRVEDEVAGVGWFEVWVGCRGPVDARVCTVPDDVLLL